MKEGLSSRQVRKVFGPLLYCCLIAQPLFSGLSLVAFLHCPLLPPDPIPPPSRLVEYEPTL